MADNEVVRDQLIAVPAADAEPYVRLGRTKQGRMFKKHILTMGDLLYPGVKGGKVTIDDAFVANLTRNFNDGICDIVQVPKAGANNEHTEDPDRNIGEVTDIVQEGRKIYAYIDARTDDAEKLGKTLLGASAMMSLNYKDTHTGEYKGPTLLHVAVTNRPYITKLDDFEEVREELLAATSEYTEDIVLLTPLAAETESAPMPTLDEYKAQFKTEHGIDVDALLVAAKANEATVDLTAKLADALKGIDDIKLSNTNSDEAPRVDEVVGAVADLVEKNVALSQSNDTLNVRLSNLEKSAIDAEVAGLVKEGRILPAQVADFTELALSNRSMFDRLVPADAIVTLSQESGVTIVDEQPELDIDATVARIAARGADKGLNFAVKA